MRESPHLAPDWRTPVTLVVAIARRNPGDELFEGIGRTARTNHDGTVLDRHVHRVAFVDLSLGGHRFRKTEAETIAPFSNLRFRRHVSTLNIRAVGQCCQNRDGDVRLCSTWRESRTVWLLSSGFSYRFQRVLSSSNPALPPTSLAAARSLPERVGF